MMQTENYPELRATAGFRDLQAQLEGTENRIAVERKRYNEAVKDYNTAIRKLPASLFAGMLGFDKVPYYEGEKNMNIERAPTVDFGK
jgi:LemA protein